jgi:hypothetical protein
VSLTTSSNDCDEAAIFTKRRSFANDELIKAPSFRFCLQPQIYKPADSVCHQSYRSEPVPRLANLRSRGVSGSGCLRGLPSYRAAKS